MNDILKCELSNISSYFFPQNKLHYCELYNFYKIMKIIPHFKINIKFKEKNKEAYETLVV